MCTGTYSPLKQTQGDHINGAASTSQSAFDPQVYSIEPQLGSFVLIDLFSVMSQFIEHRIKKELLPVCQFLSSVKRKSRKLIKLFE